VYNVFAGQQINAYYAGYKKGEIFTYNWWVNVKKTEQSITLSILHTNFAIKFKQVIIQSNRYYWKNYNQEYYQRQCDQCQLVKNDCRLQIQTGSHFTTELISCLAAWLWLERSHINATGRAGPPSRSRRIWVKLSFSKCFRFKYFAL
jgi:hypothetical protein